MTKLIINDNNSTKDVRLNDLKIGDWFRCEFPNGAEIYRVLHIDRKLLNNIEPRRPVGHLKTGAVIFLSNTTPATPIKRVEVNL